jgi:hypothetical protein
LNHTNIAAIYDFEEIDGVRFLILEFVEGETLAAFEERTFTDRSRDRDLQTNRRRARSGPR